jgi:hypothetical protein
MTLATKNGSLIVTGGKIAENCGCCDPCPLPPLPDFIEVEIASGQSETASLVMGQNPASGPVVYKYAPKAVWAKPRGTFVLTPGSTAGSYGYSNGSIGVFLEAFIVKDSATTRRIELGFTFSPLRVKTLLDTSVPPTTESMLADSWLDDGCLEARHPDFFAGGITYQPYKCTFGSGSQSRFRAPFRLRDSCNAGTVTRQLTANFTNTSSVHLACLSSGCIFPAVIESGQHAIIIPRTASNLMQATTDLNYHRVFPNYLFIFDRSGNAPSATYQPTASGKATATIQSVSLVYGSARVAMFAANGTEACSARAGNNFNHFPTLPSSLVPLTCP